MKLWKRVSAALLSVLTLTAILTGPVLAAEPDSGIAVQMDGKELSFTDAAPEIANDRTFLPFRAVLEAMGAEVGYDGATQTVTAKKDGVELSMVIGQTALTITENGETRTQEMDAAPYIKGSNGRTYIPVRYAAEAFGYSVGWDQDDKTVILVDVDALFDGATFTLMDNLSAYSNKQAVNDMSMTGALTLDVTDKSGTVAKPIGAKGSLDGISGVKGAQLNWALELSDPSALLGDASSSPVLAGMIAGLSDLKGEVRMDLESAMIYLTLPAALTGASEDAWYSVDLSAYEAQMLTMVDMSQIAQLEDATVGEALTWVMKQMPLNDKDVSYQTLKLLAKTYTDMLSDQAFTQKGDTYTAKTTLEDMIDLEVVLIKQGEDITAIDLTMTADMDENGTKMSMSMIEHAAPDKVNVVMDMSVTNAQADVSFHMDLNCVPTDKAPQTQPPAGAQIVPLA